MKNKLVIFFALCLAMASCNTDPELGFAEFERVTVSEISDTEAKINWSIIKKGDLHNAPSIDNLFICYSASNNKPTINDLYIAPEHFYYIGNEKLTGLIPGTKYYARISLDGILYSDVVTFTTTGQNPNPSVDPNPNPSADPGMNVIEVNSQTFLSRGNYDDSTNPERLKISGTVLFVCNEECGSLILVDDYGTVPVGCLRSTIGRESDKSFATLGIKTGSHITICGTKATYDGVQQLEWAYLVSNDSYTNTNILVPTIIEKPFKYPQSFNATWCNIFRNVDGCWFLLGGDDWEIGLIFMYENESSTSIIPYGTYTISSTYKYGTIGAGEGYSRAENAYYGSFCLTHTNLYEQFNLCFLTPGTVTVSAGTNKGQKINISAKSSVNTSIDYSIDNLELKNFVVTSGTNNSPRKLMMNSNN